ncbi:response regulator [Desulfobulbus rhabdoformis]|uniref:response regulator n=1 Tax=Desulfobulbus rhabdoformis TaxID=34032 RepID=UPI001963F636|nr:response regulator [Desulfobulbus rhabdoformis]
MLTLLCLLLAVYALFTFLFYFIHLRPRLGEVDPLSLPDNDGTGPQKSLKDGETIHPGLQHALAQWQFTFEAIIDPVLILDNELRVVSANEPAVDLLSVNGEPIEGKFCHQLFAGSETICPFCPVQTVRQEGKAQRREQNFRYLGRIFSLSCSPLFHQGTIVGFVYFAKDISVQRNLEKQLVHAHKLESIATLAGGIAHDFNNILGAILGNADLLLYRLPKKEQSVQEKTTAPITYEEIGEHIQAIRRAGNRAKELVTQILAFSRQSVNERHNLLIAPVLKESCRLLRASLPATIEMRLSVADKVGMIYADGGQIQQVIMHLCANAAQALENQSGFIDISLRETETGKAEQLRYHNLAPGRYVVLTVKDNGRGMSPEMLERIFDPFFTTREVGDGSGMGLSVLHGIIVSHDGIIDVNSEVGKGSAFTVFFPRVEEEKKDQSEGSNSMPRGTETILFVDDEEDIVTMRTRMLSYLGYRVLPATSPEQALAYFTGGQEQIDLVITDHTMPRMTGLALAREVMRHHPNVPIILCSGYSEAVTLEEALDAGVSRFLAKPVDMRLLAIAIREILPNRNGGEI